jgi:hypothetical protein
MKITSVDVMELKLRNDKQLRPIVCRVNTDEGIYGYGEAAMAYGVGASAAFGMIKDLSANIIGMNPLENEVVWDKLYKGTFWGQNGGPVVFGGISAIDIALWDIRGKFFNVPIYKLLGGKRREKLRTYASQLQFRWGDGVNPAYATQDYAAAAIASQYAAQLYDLKIVRERIEDQVNNVTRFLVIGKKITDPTGDDKTSLMFAVKDEPGILYRMLEPFARRGINLCKIESRPMKRKAWEYVFFLDLLGHVTEPAVSEAVDELKGYCQFVKILGSYPRSS